MESALFTIRGSSGTSVYIDSDDQMVQTQYYRGPTSFSGEWFFLGLKERKGSGFGPLIPSTKAFKLDPSSLRYKNGKCKYHVVDLDHGTPRIWGEGVEYIGRP